MACGTAGEPCPRSDGADNDRPRADRSRSAGRIREESHLRGPPNETDSNLPAPRPPRDAPARRRRAPRERRRRRARSASFVTFESGPGAAARAVAGRHAALRGQHAGQPARDLRRRRRRPRRTPARCRSASSRSRSRRAATARSGSSTTSPTASASSTSASTPPRVVRTLLVGDEPRDIVFAGPGGNRAFITTAHRGQNSPVDPRAHHRRASAAPTSGCSTRPTSARALGGTPLDHRRRSSATRRARSRVSARRQHRLRGRLPLRQPDDGAVTRALVCDGGAGARRRAPSAADRCPGGLPAPNANCERRRRRPRPG